jgi:hypothetical protein
MHVRYNSFIDLTGHGEPGIAVTWCAVIGARFAAETTGVLRPVEADATTSKFFSLVLIGPCLHHQGRV